MDKYKYQDKQKEAVRVKKLAEYKAKQAEKERQAALSGGQNDKKRKQLHRTSAWSEKQEAKDRKLDRQLKKQRKREYLKRVANGEIKEGEDKGEKSGDGEGDDSDGNDDDEDDTKKGDAKGGEVEEDEEDSWEALAREERLAKKVKKGKLSAREFDKEVGNMFGDL